MKHYDIVLEGQFCLYLPICLLFLKFFNPTDISAFI